MDDENHSRLDLKCRCIDPKYRYAAAMSHVPEKWQSQTRKGFKKQPFYKSDNFPPNFLDQSFQFLVFEFPIFCR